MRDRTLLLRRRALLALAGGWLAAGPATRADERSPPTGWLRPGLPAPALQVITAAGRRLPLPQLLAGKVTAVQLMFTGCSSVCPVQGALFAAAAPQLRSADLQLLSISIDALGDTPATLCGWQARLGPHPAWHAAVADAADVDRLGDFLKGAVGQPGTHTTQVFVFDRDARLRHRTGDLPTLADIGTLLDHTSAA